MLFDILKPKEEGGPAPYIHTIAIPLISAGILILAAPGYSDLLLRLLDKHFHTHLDFAQSPITGFILLFLGVFIYVAERIGAMGSNTLLALRHQSFLPLPPTLSRSDLPRKIAMKRVRSIDCDLYPVMNATPQNVEAALSIQTDWAQRVVGAITGAPDAPVAYYGIVHIPFQFIAGSRFSTFRRFELFELERGTDRWRKLASGRRGLPLPVKVDRDHFSEPYQDVAIRVSISYLVHLSEVAKVLPLPFADVHLRILTPHIDAVNSHSDVWNISSVFRREIDNDQVRGKRLHIFYSGPVSLGFSLGQQISPSIHGEVRIYNYDAGSSPAYGWSIRMSQNVREFDVRRH